MDINRLANIIFQRGEKLHEKSYKMICESLESDIFTLSEHVADYKAIDSVLGKNVYVLQDGTRVLVSRELIESLNSLNTDKDRLGDFMSQSQKNFKNVIGILLDGST
jgi:hypothetical protein